jgi:hypothetical protein
VAVADRGSRSSDTGSDADHTSAQAELLTKADLFSGLERVSLAKLAANLDRVVHADGEAACIQGDIGGSQFLVSEGRFDVFVHGQEGTRDDRVASLGRGACFGEMALADVVEPHLARLSPESRRTVLQASLLGPHQARSLDIIFGAESERIKAVLAEIGWQAGPPALAIPHRARLCA